MKIFLKFLFILCAVACMQCASDSSKSNLNTQGMEAAKAAYTENATEQTATIYITELQKLVASPECSEVDKKTYISEALTVANASKIIPLEASLLHTSLKQYGVTGQEESIRRLGSILLQLGKPEAANTLLYGYTTLVSDVEKVQNVKAEMTVPIENIDTFINTIRVKMFESPDKFGLNEANADVCEAYAMVNENGAKAPIYLFDAAEVAKTLKSYPKSFSLFDWVIDKYPTSEKAPTSLFLKGFIMENEIGNDEKAKEFYDSFISKYPSHELTDDVQFLIENLGKSDEEILKMIEAKNKAQ
jgi:tetratricopeptide (TPR) repeat protein